MVALTREQRRRRVLELHNQGMGTREIAEILHMSFTDIGKFLKDADKEKEAEQQRTRQEYLSSRAYKLFSEGKSPVQVAIDLNIRASEAIVFQREYWDLKGIHELNQIYEEIKGDTRHLVNLWKSVKAAAMAVPHVLTLLNVANNDLPSFEYKYETLKQEVNSLQERKRKLYNRVTEEGSNLEYFRVACQREKDNLKILQQRRKAEEALVRDFQNNNTEYVKIIKTVEEKVRTTLSNAEGRKLIKLAVLAVTESIRENPAKYSQLVQQDMSSTTGYFNQDFDPFYYGQQPPQQQVQSKGYFIEDYVAMLEADADKLYNILAKDLVDEILNERPVNKASPTLPMLPALDENSPQMDRSEETKQ